MREQASVFDKAVCTIITKSYLAHARTLAQSIRKYSPNTLMLVLLADELDDSFDPQLEPFRLIFMENLSDQETISKMCFYYDPFELCCALRGLLHEYLFQEESIQKWIFLDSDIVVYHSLDEIWQQLDGTSILLSPHITKPTSPELSRMTEFYILVSGIFNGGFLGLRKTDETRKFLSWFKNRLTVSGYFDYNKGQHIDQLWLTLVPLFFQEYKMLCNPGANVAYWNLQERNITQDIDGDYLVNGEPLMFFHFSGFNPEKPGRLTRFETVKNYMDSDPISKLVYSYQESLLANDYSNVNKYSYAFSNFHSGEPITHKMRQLYYAELTKGIVHQSSPFDMYPYFNSLLNVNGEHRVRQTSSNLKQRLMRWASRLVNG